MKKIPEWAFLPLGLSVGLFLAWLANFTLGYVPRWPAFLVMLVIVGSGLYFSRRNQK
ncbi:MAG: hypothetical protein R3E13_07085 [Alphaproteobacteria bacterium]